MKNPRHFLGLCFDQKKAFKRYLILQGGMVLVFAVIWVIVKLFGR